MSGIPLGWGESARAFKGIICDDISKFESSHASHAVGSLSPREVETWVGPKSSHWTWAVGFANSAKSKGMGLENFDCANCDAKLMRS